MKRLLKLTLSGVSVAVISAVFSANAATAYNGDLIIGFTAGSGNDLVYDLGSAASLTDGQSWNLSALLSGYTLSSVNWGIIGNTLNGGTAGADNQLYTMTADSALLPGSVNQSLYNGLNTQTKNMYGFLPAAGAGQHASVSSTLANSWNSQTLNPTLPTQYKNAYESPNVSGLASGVLWSVDTQGAATTEMGTFTLDSSGSITFSAVPVPEPTTCALTILGGLLLLSVRRRQGLMS